MKRIYSVTIEQIETVRYQYEVTASDQSEAEELAWDAHGKGDELGTLRSADAEVIDIVEGGEHDNEDR